MSFSFLSTLIPDPKFFFFFLVWALSPPSAKMPWGYLSVKVLSYKVKRIIYSIYNSMTVYVLSINLLNGHLCFKYQLTVSVEKVIL